MANDQNRVETSRVSTSGKELQVHLMKILTLCKIYKRLYEIMTYYVNTINKHLLRPAPLSQKQKNLDEYI